MIYSAGARKTVAALRRFAIFAGAAGARLRRWVASFAAPPVAHHHRRDDDDANRDRRRREPSADRSRRGPPGQPRESPPKPAAASGAPGGDRQPRSFDAPRAATEGEALAPEGYAPLNTGPKGWIFVLHDGAFYLSLIHI